MIASCALALLVIAPPTMFEQVVPQPTNRNGYEEYVRAADLASQPDCWERLGVATEFAPEGDRIRRLADLVDDYGQISELIRAGNAKPIRDPRGAVDFDTPFPEYAGFRNVARYLAAEAEYRFLMGEPNRGVQTLMDALTFADRAGRIGPLISGLVALACQQVAFTALERNLGFVAVPGARSMIQAADRFLAQPPMFAGSLDNELAAIPASLRMTVDRPESYLFGNDERLRGDLGAVPPAELNAFLAEAAQDAGQLRAAIAQAWTRPEPQWRRALNEVILSREGANPPLARRLVDAVTPVIEPLGVYELRLRAQWRVMRLHGAAILARAETGRVPTEPRSFGQAAWWDDPLSGGTFVFEAGPEGYRIMSNGIPETGRVGMAWRRAAAAPVTAPSPP